MIHTATPHRGVEGGPRWLCARAASEAARARLGHDARSAGGAICGVAAGLPDPSTGSAGLRRPLRIFLFCAVMSDGVGDLALALKVIRALRRSIEKVDFDVQISCFPPQKLAVETMIDSVRDDRCRFFVDLARGSMRDSLQGLVLHQIMGIRQVSGFPWPSELSPEAKQALRSADVRLQAGVDHTLWRWTLDRLADTPGASVLAPSLRGLVVSSQLRQAVSASAEVELRLGFEVGQLGYVHDPLTPEEAQAPLPEPLRSSLMSDLRQEDYLAQRVLAAPYARQKGDLEAFAWGVLNAQPSESRPLDIVIPSWSSIPESLSEPSRLNLAGVDRKVRFIPADLSYLDRLRLLRLSRESAWNGPALMLAGGESSFFDLLSLPRDGAPFLPLFAARYEGHLSYAAGLAKRLRGAEREVWDGMYRHSSNAFLYGLRNRYPGIGMAYVHTLLEEQTPAIPSAVARAQESTANEDIVGTVRALAEARPLPTKVLSLQEENVLAEGVRISSSSPHAHRLPGAWK